jgi:hypothetical protein
MTLLLILFAKYGAASFCLGGILLCLGLRRVA